MSSTLLYLAIVAVWAVVLVPMWLRREPEAPSPTALSRLITRRPASDPDPESAEYDFDDTPTVDDTPETEDFVSPRPASPPPLSSPRPTPSIRRAAIIARRRRRTAAFTLLSLTALVTAIFTAAPWWIPLPPTALLLSHLALLRTATRIDQSRRREAFEARRVTVEATIEEAPLPTAEIITFTPPQEVFDQYATESDTPRRAVGD